MENDPNKKESKGKRIFKKAVRRNSKCSNNGQEAGAGAGASRSRSVEAAPEPAAAPHKLEVHDSHNRALAQALLKEQQPVPNEPFPVPKETSKRSLKRKLEEESGIAGTSGAGAGASESDADDKDPSKDKKKKNRCAVCRKKVGLTGFECRCGGLFCAVHRYSDKHECSFDYRELGAQEIRRNNPVVVSQKIHKI